MGNELCGLDQWGNGIYKAEGITKLCEGLKGSAVTSLNLGSNNLTDYGEDMSGLLKLAEVLPQTKIESLGLEGNGIGAEGTSALAAILNKTKITELNLGYNFLDDQAKQAVKDAAGSSVSISF